MIAYNVQCGDIYNIYCSKRIAIIFLFASFNILSPHFFSTFFLLLFVIVTFMFVFYFVFTTTYEKKLYHRLIMITYLSILLFQYYFFLLFIGVISVNRLGLLVVLYYFNKCTRHRRSRSL